MPNSKTSNNNMDIEKMLKRITNTIVSNINGTDDVSLFHGKMGACLFLFAYARHTGKELYERLAERMFNESYFANKQNMMAGIAEGYGGIGVGLCWLLLNGFLRDNTVNYLEIMDALLIENAQKCLRNDCLYAAPYYSSVIYLRWRKLLKEYPLCEKDVHDIETGGSDIFKKSNRKGGFKGDPEVLWWNFVLQEPLAKIPISAVLQRVNQIQKDYVYEVRTANGYMSILGLYLLRTI